MILKGEIKDPRVSAAVISGVKVTNDLGLAKVFFTTTITEDVDREDVLRGLESAKGFIKRVLWKRMKMKRAIDLRFEYDSSVERGYRIDDILRDVRGE